jgi:hypothetical protein
MKAILTKLQFDSKDEKQKIQFRINENENHAELLDVWRESAFKFSLENPQSQIDEKTGEIKNLEVFIAPEQISMSICPIDNGQIWTITATFYQKDVGAKIVEAGIVGKIVNLTFREV